MCFRAQLVKEDIDRAACPSGIMVRRVCRLSFSITVEAYGVAVCHLLGRAKGMAGNGRLLMVKVSIPRRTRYPWHPRKGLGRPDFFWPPPKKFPAETHIQLIGNLKAVEVGCRATVCACLRDLGRAPDCISCRLGRSLATPQTLQLLADPDIHAH